MSIIGKLLNRPPKPDEFAKDLGRRFKDAGLADLAYSSEGFFFRQESASRSVFLDNVYRNYCAAARGEREEIVRDFVQAFVTVVDVPADFASARAKLMPVLRDYRYASLSRLSLQERGATETPDWPALPFASELVLQVCYDGERTIHQLNHKQFTEWQIGADQALAIAKDNLRDQSDPKGLKELAPGSFAGDWGDYYDAARLVLTDYFYRLELSGAPVAFVPNRHILLVCGSDDDNALSAMLKIGGETHFDEGYALSPNLYRLVDKNWELFVPENTELRRKLVVIQKRREGTDYTQQAESLNKINGRENRDIFVASYELYKTPDDEHVSWCVWSNGVDTLLPQTDEVALFVNPGNPDSVQKDVLRLPWKVIADQIGEMLEPVSDLVPVRYRVRSFPSAEQVQQLRPHARKVNIQSKS